MRTKIYLVTLLIAFVTIFGLTACMNEDEPKDITKEVTMYVSSETGIMYDLFDSEGEFPIECMLVKEQGEDEYRPLAFCGIQGFEYEKGYEYDLRVNKTTLANPPADGSIYKYQLVRVVEKDWSVTQTKLNNAYNMMLTKQGNGKPFPAIPLTLTCDLKVNMKIVNRTLLFLATLFVV